MIKRKLLFTLIVSIITTHANAGTALDDGTAFATSINPTSPTQLVNPAAVNPKSWTNPNTPSVVTPNMGAFSNPTNDNTTLTSAKAVGLTGIGLQTQADCANYVHGTDPLQDQQCAAVNFMSNNCIPHTASEQSVLGNVPIASVGSNNCNGTYGQGATKFNYGAQMVGTDPIFSNVTSSQLNAPTTMANGACTPQTVTTTPAQYATNVCLQSSSTTQVGCSQNLNTTSTTTANCAASTWFATTHNGRDGLGPSHPDQMYAQARCDMTQPGEKQTYQIFAQGGQGACIGWQQILIDPLVANTTPIAAPSLSPHWNGYCNPMTTSYTHNGCPGNNCSTTFNFYTSYSYCPGGSGGFGGCAAYCPGGGFVTSGIFGSSCSGGGAPSTSPVTVKQIRGSLSLNYQKPHYVTTVKTNWVDSCTPYETSAGKFLPTPP